MDSTSLKPLEKVGNIDIVVWRGDICSLRVDAIVNAANSAMLGCFQPSHRCIDNVIHRAAGPRLREACRSLIQSEIKDEEKEEEDEDEENGWSLQTGDARITKAFGSLPSKHVVHTVGPIVESEKRGKPGKPTAKQEAQLESCYASSLRLADEHKLESIALCCISTGLFGYPQHQAAQVALRTVRSYLSKNKDTTTLRRVIFNVFLPEDHRIYLRLLMGKSDDDDDDDKKTLGEAFAKTFSADGDNDDDDDDGDDDDEVVFVEVEEEIEAEVTDDEDDEDDDFIIRENVTLGEAFAKKS